MRQSLALEIMLQGHSVLLTGQAGSGKTYVLNEFIRIAKLNGKAVAVTATTGLAATHLNGTTIHAWSGIGIHDELPKNFLQDMPKSRRETIEKADILVIDEISMLHHYRLDMIDAATRLARGNSQPFGGLQIILCGDFFQLPPVSRQQAPTGKFVVHSEAWQTLKPVICYLSEQFRQNDDTFLEILTAIRTGDVRRRHAEALLQRVNAKLPDNQIATELYTTNIDVDSLNQRMLGEIHEASFTFHMQTTGKENYVQQLKRACLAQEQLTLKKGAQVMCIKNSPDKKYVNGSLGIVQDFEEVTHHPIVQLRSGATLPIRPETWELRDGDKKRASLTQIPLRLAWAITVHKSQGMTLDAAHIDLRRAFVEGMGYVALSRVKRLDSLSLIGINQMALQISQDALEIDGQLHTQAEQARQNFKNLENKAAKRQKEQKAGPPTNKTATNSNWAERLEAMRQTYPNAFRPWPQAEDKKLLKLFKQGSDVADISKALGRQPGSIHARLKKHLGDDVPIR